MLADFLLVGLPPETRWVPRNDGGVVPTGLVSARLKGWTVGNDNLLAKLCNVPFDRTSLPMEGAGITPTNHRLLSFGHDPSPIGMVYGLLDIVSGGMTGITRDGQAFHLASVPPDMERMLMAPLLWIGHLVSDVATPMGLPAPGWSLTQLLQVPAPGASGEATMADVARMMYEQGYDFRHYLAGAIVPGLIEVIIRVYHFVRYVYPHRTRDREGNLVSANLAEDYAAESRLSGHLTAMLFWAQATATAINAGKVLVQGLSGNYFSAVRCINLAQWQMFAVRTVQYLAHRFREKSLEQAVSNRKLLNQRWAELDEDISPIKLLEEPQAPSLVIIQGARE